MTTTNKKLEQELRMLQDENQKNAYKLSGLESAKDKCDRL